MDQEAFLNIVKDISTLEGLKGRLEDVEQELNEAENQRDELLKAYNKEKRDVDRLQGETLSSMFVRLVGKYDEKLDKETREMLESKIRYDWAYSRVEELKANKTRLAEEIERIKRSMGEYRKEFKRREQALMEMEDNELSLRYRKLKDREKELSRQLVEYDETIRSAGAAISACDDVLESLHIAERWATYDALTKEGVLSYMAKYNHLDKAQEQMNRLNSILADMKKELKDADMSFDGRLIDIGSGKRAIDFWFDNIFTDISVRNTIEDNIEIVEDLKRNIEYVIPKLNSEKKAVEYKRKQIEEEIRGLIVEFGNVKESGC